MVSVYKITLDTQRSDYQVILDGVRRGDTATRRVEIQLTEAGQPLQLPEQCFITMWVTLPNGNISYSTCEIENGVIIHVFRTSELAVPGDVLCEVRVTDINSAILVSPRFKLRVSDILQDDRMIESTNEYSALTEAIAEMQVKGEAAAAAAQNANTAAEEVRALLPGKATSYVLQWTDERETEGYEAVIAHNKEVLHQIEAAPLGSCHIVLQAGQQEYPLCRMMYEGQVRRYCFAGLLDSRYIPYEYVVWYQPAAGSQAAECDLEKEFTANNLKMELGNLLPPTTTMTAAMLGTKVDKEDGKGLSANDYTTEEKTKLAGIAEGANLYVHPTASSAGAMGLYKVAIDGTGHISEKAAVTKEDITPLLDIEAILSGLPDAMEEDY